VKYVNTEAVNVIFPYAIYTHYIARSLNVFAHRQLLKWAIEAGYLNVNKQISAEKRAVMTVFKPL